jgi:hypothetical protein
MMGQCYVQISMLKGSRRALNIGPGGTTYCFSKALNSGSLYQCIDSTGAVKTSAMLFVHLEFSLPN